jgi:serine/threonine-protein kinase RsbW
MELQSYPGDLDALAPIREFVKSAAQQAGLNRKATYNLCLAVDEIVTNVVTHGYEEAGLQGDLRIGAEIKPERLIIYLEDTGKSYDPNSFELPALEDLDEPLEGRPVGGLGILLAKSGVDELNYSEVDNKHVHQFIVRRDQHA